MGPKRDFSDEIRFKDKKDFLTKLNKLGDLGMKKIIFRQIDACGQYFKGPKIPKYLKARSDYSNSTVTNT